MPTALTVTDGSLVQDDRAAAFGQALAAAPFGAHVAGLRPGASPPPLLPAPAGRSGWMAGPYAGELLLDGERLRLEPRMGWRALGRWMGAATSLPAVADVLADAPDGEIPPLAAAVWMRAVDGASRHGPPAFRRDIAYEGTSVRGHLDVRKTVRLRAKGASRAASVYRARDLDNPVTRVIVAADRSLVRQVGHTRWRTQRVESIMPQLHSAVGRRSHVPRERELETMRYTPITRPFKWAAEVSWRVVQQDPLVTATQPGRVQGLLLDLEDVWRGAVMDWAREARPDLRVDTLGTSIVLFEHGRRRGAMNVRAGAHPSGAPAVRTDTSRGTDERLLGPTFEDAVAVVRDIVQSV